MTTSPSDYQRMLGLSLEQLLVLETQILMAATRSQDPRLQKGFCFFARPFKNKARVLNYCPETDRVTVEVFYGANGSSFVEYDWCGEHYIWGYENSEYLPLSLQPQESIGFNSTLHDFCAAYAPRARA